ncbi:MAG: hypothetical protein M3464_12830 [Chloroflexota bacterium]|nr:hypothetical protein [Chloroflexota bacterium]
MYTTEEHDIPELYAMDPDGGNKVRLTETAVFEGQPAVSPDGDRIAFISDEAGGNTDIYVMDADGAN